MATKTNQLSLDLSQVKDLSTREALLAVVRFVNDMASIGIATDGPLSCRSVGLTQKTAGVDAQGNLFARTLELDNGMKFKVMVQKGSLAASGSQEFKVPGFVLGAFGYTTFAGGANTGRPMAIGSATTQIVMASSSSVDINSVVLTNTDSSNANNYNLVIFYTD